MRPNVAPEPATAVVCKNSRRVEVNRFMRAIIREGNEPTIPESPVIRNIDIARKHSAGRDECCKQTQHFHTVKSVHLFFTG